MTKVDYFGLEDFDIATDQSILRFSSSVFESATVYEFRNSSGDLVTVTGQNMTFNGSGRFVSGTVTKIEAARSGDDSSVNLRVSGFSIDGTELFGSNGASVPGNIEFWRNLFDGDVDLAESGIGQVVIGLDGLYLDTGTSFSGGNNSARGDYASASDIIGGFEDVYGPITFFGGDFDFVGQARRVVGDALEMYSGITVVGGDDSLVFDRGSDNPELLSGSFLYWVGDVHSAYDFGANTALIGGDDFIDVEDAVTDEFVYVHGDIEFSASNMSITGGDDEIIGAKNSRNILSGDMDDVQATQAFVGGDDTITGGKLNDILYGDHRSDVNGYAGGDDRIFGGGGDDTLFGNGGDDRLSDGTGTGTIFGGDGDDRFKPLSNGAHSFNGGNGIDTLDYSDSKKRVTIDLEAGTAKGGWAADDTFTNIEAVKGSLKGDTLYGSDGSDTLSGATGNDSLLSRGGDDLIFAGKGEDQIRAGSGANTYFGGKGFDVLDYRDSSAGIKVNLKKDNAFGGYAAGDSISGVENIFATDEKDVLKGNGQANFLRGREGADKLFGAKNQDRLEGQSGNDDLFGGRASDKLFGGKGKDELDGGKGNDFLKGGKGRDEFHFSRGDDIDVIRDFQNNRDTLVLDDLGKNALSKAQNYSDGVFIDFGKGDQLFIEGMTIAQLKNDIDYG